MILEEIFINKVYINKKTNKRYKVVSNFKGTITVFNDVGNILLIPKISFIKNYIQEYEN